MVKATKKTPAPRRLGRPVSPAAARETFQLRVTGAQRQPWQDAAQSCHLTESEWAREGLDAWARVCRRAAELGLEPAGLVTDALEDHARVRAAVAELAAARSLSTNERRLLRVLAPAAWARREAS